MSHPLGVPPPLYSECPFCNENLQKQEEPDICGGCLSLIWYVKVNARGKKDWCDLAGHSRAERKYSDGIVKVGHQTQLEQHTEARCRSMRRST